MYVYGENSDNNSCYIDFVVIVITGVIIITIVLMVVAKR